MQSFPPLEQAPLDSLLPLTLHLEYIQPLKTSKEFVREDFDYLVIIYWSRFMGRQSEKFIEVIQKNQQLIGNLKVKYIYVNTDNCFARAD